MSRLSMQSIAQRMRDAYYNPGQLHYKAKIKGDNALAYLQQDDTLVIVGSNDSADWFDNLSLWSVSGAIYPIFHSSQVRAARWHFGFLRHASLIATKLGSTRPRFVIGHSLGGAVAQVLSVHYLCPGVTFGAPKACQYDIAHSQHLNVIYKKDPVPEWPDTGGFYKWVGDEVFLPEDATNEWPHHNMKQYMPRVDAALSSGLLRSHWPA